MQVKCYVENVSFQKFDFLVKISYEICIFLNVIIGFFEVMMEECFGLIGNECYKDYLKDIRIFGFYIMSLVNDLFDLFKIEVGKLDLKFFLVLVNEIINECVVLMQLQVNCECVIICVSLLDLVLNVVVDICFLRQIVFNLFFNVIKYNCFGGQVILLIILEFNGEVVVWVWDIGIGMIFKQLVVVFELFW